MMSETISDEEAAQARPWKVLLYTCAAVFIVTLDATILFVAFPAIRASYPHVSTANLSWILNAYTIVVGAMLIPAAAYADKFGRKRIFLIGVPIFTAGSLLCGISHGVWLLVAARTLQGLGAALLTPTSLSLVLGEFQKEKRAIAIAAWGAVAALAAAVGPALGSAIIHFLTWRWVFFINVPIGLWCWIQGRRVLHEAKLNAAAPVPRLVAAGQIALALALVSLAIVQGKSWGWVNSKTLLAAAAGLVLFLVFVSAEFRSRRPLVDWSLFRSKNFRFSNYTTLVFSAAFSAMFLGNVFFLKELWHYGTIEIGLAMTVGPLCVVLCALVTGKYAGKHGHAKPFLVGGLLYAASAVIRLATLDFEANFLLLWLPTAILSGIGVGMIFPSLSSSATFDLPPTRYSIGSGVNNSIRQLGSVLGIAFAVLCVGSEGAHAATGFTALYSGLTAAAVVTALLGVHVSTAPVQDRSTSPAAVTEVK
jgi:EmrB/QacA subfamily drug resistance transporter